MKKLKAFLLMLIFISVLFIPTESCKHEPSVFPIATDTTKTNPTDTNKIIPPISSLDSTGWRCSVDTVYFQYDVLPVFVSACAISGCHNATSRVDGYQLTDYANAIKKGVSAGKATSSKIYNEIANGSMPPRNSGITMTQAQKDIVAKWINQGAKNLSCNPNFGSCDTTKVLYSTFVKPLIQNKCLGCHTGGTNDVSTFAAVQKMALNGKLYGSIAHLQGYRKMPDNSPQLPSCEVSKIQAWVKKGALNN
jgi:uncharacterized membrane protein